MLRPEARRAQRAFSPHSIRRPIGPWQKVDADAQLPNGQHVLQYGPMIHEHLLADDGLEVPYLLSQLFPVYNVYHHSYRITVAEGSACAQ